MKNKTVVYPVGGFPKDKFGFPHYEKIQQQNKAFQKDYNKTLEQRKIQSQNLRGAFGSKQWVRQTVRTRKTLCKLLNLETTSATVKHNKPEVVFKTSFKHQNHSYVSIKYKVQINGSEIFFTELASYSVPQNNLCLIIPSSGVGHNGLQSPQDIINEYLYLIDANCKLLIPHFESIKNFSATNNKGLLIQGQSQLAIMTQESIQIFNHYMTIKSASLTNLIVGGKGIGATVALFLGALSPVINGVFASGPAILGKDSTHEALMIPYFNRETNMEEIISFNLNQNLLLSSTEELTLPKVKNKNCILLRESKLSPKKIKDWVKNISNLKNISFEKIRLASKKINHRQFNITKYKSIDQWNKARPKLLKAFKQLSNLNRSLKPISVKKIGESKLDDCLRTEYHVQTSSNTLVNLTFYQPKGTTKRLPTVLCLPGSGSDVAKLESQYVHEVIAKGWNAISIDARVRLYDFHPSIPESSSIIMQSVFDILVCCDWIFQNPLVETTKVATMGISQGATHSWMLAALEPRICVAAPGCGFCTYESVINEKVNEYYGGSGNSFLDSHSIYYYIPYLLQYADQQDLCALIAPRNLILVCADHDNCFPLSGIRKGASELKNFYKMLNKSENFKLVEFEGPHSMPLETREQAYSFFEKVFKRKKS